MPSHHISLPDLLLRRLFLFWVELIVVREARRMEVARVLEPLAIAGPVVSKPHRGKADLRRS